MAYLRLIIVVLATFAAVGSARVQGGPTTAATSRPASAATVVIELEGEINDFRRDTLVRRFEEARRLGASTVILTVNSYGGLVTSGLDISRFIKRQDDLHVIAFVDEKAISAGAMVALAADEIVMEPNALLGDCAPIAMGAGGGGVSELPAAERAKAESPILEDFYESATRNGYDPLLVQSMVSVGRVVHWVEDGEGRRRFVDGEEYRRLTEGDGGWKAVAGVRNPVDAADSLLTVSTDLAVKLGLAKGKYASPEALAADRGLSIVATLKPSASEGVVALLSSMGVRALLMTVLMFSLYMAFGTPGHGLPEAVAVVALGLLVGVPLLTGYAQWWEIIAIFVGLALLAIELFVIPGFGIAGITGVLMILFGLTMTWVGDEPVGVPGVLPSLGATWAAIQRGLIVVLVAVTASLVSWMFVGRYLPSLPFFNRLILAGPETASGSAPLPNEGVDVHWPAAGATGRAVSDLRPAGQASFLDEVVGDVRLADVVSDDGFLSAGTPVVVKQSTPTRVAVGRVGEA